MRYDKRQIFQNAREEFRDLMNKRDLNFFLQYDTPQLGYPTPEELGRLDIKYEVWKRGDRLWKYAFDNYGDSELGFVIGWYNQKPTDFHFKLGDVVEIPLPLNLILQFLKV